MADPTPFNELAAKFDPNMPAELYDQVRQHYFDTVVKPRLGHGDNPVAAWNSFKTNTERPKMDPTSRTLLPAAQAITGFAHALSTPLPTIFPGDKTARRIPKALGKAEEYLNVKARREGASVLPSYAGEFAGQLPGFALAAETGGATLEATGIETASFAAKLLRGGLSFGLFESATANEGSRLTAGVKGFGTGLAFEGALGLAGKLIKRGIPAKDVDNIVKSVLSGEKVDIPPEIDNEIAKSVQKDVQESRAEGRPQFIKEEPTAKGLSVLGHDGEGKPFTIKVQPGMEKAAVKEVLAYTRAGGAVDGLMHPPNYNEVLQRFMRASADEGAEKYEGVRVIRTATGHAPSIAVEDHLDGKGTVAVSDSEMVVQDPHRAKPGMNEIVNGVKQLKDEEGHELSKGAMMSVTRDVNALWNKDLPDTAKEEIAKRVSNWELGDMIPEQWKRPKELSEVEHIEPGETPGEIEQLRQQEIGEHEPERFGRQRFEDIGTTTPEVQAESKDWTHVENSIPDSERFEVHQTPYGPRRVVISVRPRYTAVRVSDSITVLPGATAITGEPGSLGHILERMGVEQEPPAGAEGRPVMAYPEGVRRGTIYHEGLHVDKYHVPGVEDIMQADDNAAAYSIGKGLRRISTYRGSSIAHGVEEAFVHAATAIRMGDANALRELVFMDGTVDDVFKMVHDRATSIFEATTKAMDTAPGRVLQRKMQDLVWRTTGDKAWELTTSTKDLLSDYFYDPASKTWKGIDRGTEKVFGDYKSFVDGLGKRDGTEWAPSETLWAEARGVRGPFVPRNGESVNRPIMTSEPPKTEWSGWTAISGLFRPMEPWVGDLHTRVNDALSKHGMRLPIYDRWKDVDDAFRTGSEWMERQYGSAAEALKGLGQKQYAYFDVLATDPKHWPEMAKQLGLDQSDLPKLQKLDEWLGQFRNETGILVKNYLRDELPRLRGFDYNTDSVYGTLKKTSEQMSTFERLIKEGKLDPKARHIGSFIDTMMREGMAQKYTDKPLKALEKLIGQKAKNGQYMLGNMRYPLENYVRYMRGVPDVTSQVMNKTVGEFMSFLGNRAEAMNKHLPSYAQLPTEFSAPKTVINKLMIWSYAAGLGLRASIPIRDSLQVFSTGMPVMGVSRFMSGLAKGLTKQGWQLAEEQGALLGKHTIGELYGDIFSELPAGASTDRITQFANRLLSPSRWGHNIARAVVFNGEYDSALNAVRQYRAGKMGVDELIHQDNTSLWWADKPFVDRTLAQLHDTGFSDEDIARNIALETLDLTLWPYRRGTQPTVLRTGAGRIFGQFGMWPLNYMDFLKRGASKFSEHPQTAMKTTALWAASNYAAVSAMNGAGADVGKWFWFSPAGVDMSPHAKFIENLLQAPKDSPDGREARRQVLEYPMNFFPTGLEAKNIYQVIESGEDPFDENGHPTPALLKVLGFKPLKEVPERDLEHQMLFELGYGEHHRPGR